MPSLAQSLGYTAEDTQQPASGNDQKRGITLETWTLYVQQAASKDDEFIKARNMEMDTLLIFATLFSAVLTAFVIESYRTLLEDNGDATPILLQQILTTLQNSSALNSPATPTSMQYRPTRSAIILNSFWFASLVISVASAFLAILAKQWLFSISQDFAPGLEDRGRQQQFRYDNLRRWKLDAILSSLPVLLHVSLLLFFAGLVEFLWTINDIVAFVALSLVSVALLFYISTLALSLIWPTCPFETSVTSIIRYSFSGIVRELFADVTAVFILFRLKTYGLLMWARGPWHAPDDSWWTPVMVFIRQYSFARTRRALKSTWFRGFILYLTSRYWEEHYIRDDPEEIDARALARMIAEFPSSEEGYRVLAHQLSHFAPLLTHRNILSEAGTVEFLARHLHALYTGKLSTLPHETQIAIIDQSRTLAQLLTETEENDPHSMRLYDKIPLHHDIEVLGYDDGVASLHSSGLCSGDRALDDAEDLEFFANMLRLHLVASSKKSDYSGLQRSVDAFYSRVQAGHELSTLSDEQLISVVHTVVLTAMRETAVVKSNADEEKVKAKLNARALDTLATIVVKRHDMGLAVQRQICYGVWLCAVPDRFHTRGLLMARVRNLQNLATPLAEFMLSSTPSLPDVVLATMEMLLRSNAVTVDRRTPEYKDGALLVKALVERYPDYLRTFEFTLQAPIITRLCQLRRIIGVTNLLSSSSQRESTCFGARKEVIAMEMHRILSTACGRIAEIPSDDRDSILRTCYQCACKVAIWQMQPSEKALASNAKTALYGGPSPPALSAGSVTIEDGVQESLPPDADSNTSGPCGVSARRLAEHFIVALQMGSNAADVRVALRLVLTIMNMLSRQGISPSADDLNSSILVHLRRPEHRVAELLCSLREVTDLHDTVELALVAVYPGLQDDYGVVH